MRVYALLVAAFIALVAVSPTRAEPETCALTQVASLDVITSTDGWILVPIQVGPTKLDAVIDFRARYSVLEEPLAHQLQLKLVTFERYARFIFGSYAKYKTSAPLTVGNVSLGETLFAVAQNPMGRDPRVAAKLGLDNLTRFDVELDLSHHKINLFAKDHCPGKVVYWSKNSPVSSVPLNFTADDWLRIPVQVNGKDVDAAISLTSESIYVNPHHAKENFGVEIPASALPAIDSHSTAPVQVGIKSVSIDGITFLNPATRVFDCDEAGWSAEKVACPLLPPFALGVSELEKLRIYLDFRDRLLYATTADAS